MQQPGSFDGADTRLCPECDEVVEEREFHPSCCPHEEVEVDDARDGGAGRIRLICQGCDEEVEADIADDGIGAVYNLA